MIQDAVAFTFLLGAVVFLLEFLCLRLQVEDQRFQFIGLLTAKGNSPVGDRTVETHPFCHLYPVTAPRHTRAESISGLECLAIEFHRPIFEPGRLECECLERAVMGCGDGCAVGLRQVLQHRRGNGGSFNRIGSRRNLIYEDKA